jgi:hypothetical protein
MMKYAEYNNYFVPAVKNLNLCPKSDDFDLKEDKFVAILNCKDEFHAWILVSLGKEYPMTDEFKDLLIKLAGPHGKTLLHVIKQRGGISKEMLKGKTKDKPK